ncbi:restriction endonuclease [Mucilaginibacter sp. UYCu711]|uniref:restriction endonuclease n=1 Tax=Mucilaginibacter sp. UYCu711 TaxID=3156339 RepID=UPI003D203ACE
MKIDITNSEEFKELIQRTRAREIHELSQQRFWGHVVVYGESGIGKTALLQTFRDKNPVAYLGITWLRGHEIELDESLLAPFLLSRLRRPGMNGFPELVIIDDFDQILSKPIREKVATMLKEGRHWGFRVILSAKNQINEKVFESNAEVMRLRGLNAKEVDELVEMYSVKANEPPDRTFNLRGMIRAGNGNPGDILTQLHYFLGEVPEFRYRNQIIIEELERPSIILADMPEIITDLRFVNQRLLDRIGRKPEAIRHLTPRQFEELVAELYEERGYHVQLTQQTRDGGKDLIIMNRSDIGNFMIYAECKHYAPNRPVGVSVVSDLVGRMSADRATAGMVITSSYFSPDAKVFQSKFEHQMSLIDFVTLSAWMKTKT